MGPATLNGHLSKRSRGTIDLSRLRAIKVSHRVGMTAGMLSKVMADRLILFESNEAAGRQPDGTSGWSSRTDSYLWYRFWYKQGVVVAITASEARRALFPLIEKVNDDRSAIEITSKRGNAVLMSADDYAAWQETAYLFRSPANARRLLDAAEAAERGEFTEHTLDRA